MKAVVYCRVSTDEQVKGYSLKSQEIECRAYAEKNGIEVAKCFIERGESAKTANRTELQNLLKFITLNKKEIDYVIVYKVDRLSRDVADSSTLRVIFSRLGIELKSVTEPFDGSSAGKLTANLLSALAQFDNDVRAERTILGLKQALQESRWVSAAPRGHKFDKDAEGKSNLVPNEEAIYIKKAFELFKTGLHKQTHIVKELKAMGFKRASKQTLNHILRNPLYAGFMRHDLLQEPLKGKYEPDC